MAKFYIIFLICASLVVLVYLGFFSKDKLQIGGEKKETKTVFTFFGAPGSGKGTVAEQCVKDLGFATVSTGNLLRRAIARGDEKGKELDLYLREGRLVPDKLVTDMVAEWLEQNVSHARAIILDGYPRTVEQAKLFINLIKRSFPNLLFRVVELAIKDDEIVQRLVNRLVCSNKACQAVFSRKKLEDPSKLVCPKCDAKLIRRHDDKEDVIRKRLRVYDRNKSALLNFYKSTGIRIDVLVVEGKSMKQVFKDFKKVIGR